MNKCDSTCHGCLWADNCNFGNRCDDYTPMNDEQDISYYKDILKENDREYRLIMLEADS